jgi:hypothetical protein
LRLKLLKLLQNGANLDTKGKEKSVLMKPVKLLIIAYRTGELGHALIPSVFNIYIQTLEATRRVYKSKGEVFFDPFTVKLITFKYHLHYYLLSRLVHFLLKWTVFNYMRMLGGRLSNQ